MATEHRFWVVWNPMRGNPTVRHNSPKSAALEAERLARTNAGQRFYVLMAQRYFERNDVRSVDLYEDDDSIPF